MKNEEKADWFNMKDLAERFWLYYKPCEVADTWRCSDSCQYSQTLLEVATIQSPRVSNRIEGIFIGEKRLEKQLDKNDKNYVYILSFMRYWGRVLLKGVAILNKYYG